MSARRFVALPEGLLVDAIRVAERLGIPYTALIERILTEVLRVLKYRRDFLETLTMVDALSDVRRLGGIYLPERSVRELLARAGPGGLGGVCSELSRTASWYAELGKVKRALTAGELKNSLELWVPSARVDLVREGEGAYKYVVSFADAPSELLELSRCVAEGLARGYGLEGYEISVGTSVLVLRVSGLGEE